ncbi:COX15/CtaA family protein [Aliidiomarina quisquiliarum]|uniref:COX15/CtaA family protein n=1 Tax=Aliidiomarina quisquiliarum TaxID=2938947 RepID=UPI00208E284C|nr:COX15/CtaA family protein [Aliidiomarina quisquiliarum]MCO4322220.1 COX15/CtaA family protein [Aliidiomarina quisquiliarum]
MVKLLRVAIVLVLIVIMLGAYTRLTDAGLGCPDWPGCYGFIKPPLSEQSMASASQAFPHATIDHGKAWNEMIHRYAAGTLGLLVFAIVTIAIRRRLTAPINTAPAAFKLPLVLGALIILQAALGMWTVTMMLQPAIVMGHLLGGFATFALLLLLYLKEAHWLPPQADANLAKLLPLAVLVLALLVLQIALGGWVAANYAALACTDLPICQGNWLERIELAGAFSLSDAATYEFGTHSYNERLTIHVFHRFGAIALLIAMSVLITRLWRQATSHWFKTITALLSLLLVVQITLGILNVLLSLPLPVAVAHNTIGALLLATMVALTYALTHYFRNFGAIQNGLSSTVADKDTKELHNG